MPRYTFTFKKDDIFVEFTTEDRDVVERQFQIWVLNADEYVKSQSDKSYKGKTINSLASMPSKPEQPAPVPASVQQPAIQPEAYQKPAETNYQTVQPQVQPQQKAQEQVFQPQPQQYVQEQQQPQQYAQQPMPQQQQFEQPKYQQQEPDTQAFDQASGLLKTINNIQNEQLQPQFQEQQPQVAFESVLEEKIEEPVFEPPKNVDQIFLNLINSKNTKDKFHYLMITAYYLTEFGKQSKFTLKQINAKLMQNISEVIDHTLLQDAINQGFIELIPDMSGMAQVGEYKLTSKGEEFFAYRI